MLQANNNAIHIDSLESEQQAILKEINDSFPGLSLEARLKAIANTGLSPIRFSSSLGMEDQVVTHFIFSTSLSIAVFTLDTGRLFEESLELLDQTRKKYGADIQVFYPDAQELQQYVSAHGAFHFYESVDARKQCCHIRKVEPLSRALLGAPNAPKAWQSKAAIWVTGLRQEQSASRLQQPFAQWDHNYNLLKVNPLVDYTWPQIQELATTHKVPVHALHAKGYPSIGCAPCTKAVRPGQDIRSGRWWWEQGNKECGLHIPQTTKTVNRKQSIQF
jgi:phosphoadenosine phosphosulfate reductase